jgi:hypothetical protein
MTHRSLAILIAVLALGACAAPPPAAPSVGATAGKEGLAVYPLVATGLLPTLSASGGGHR